MAVFVYKGLAVASGKTVSGVRDADNPKVLRAQLKREGVMLTEATEEKGGKKGRRSVDLMAFFRRGQSQQDLLFLSGLLLGQRAVDGAFGDLVRNVLAPAADLGGGGLSRGAV